MFPNFVGEQHHFVFFFLALQNLSPSPSVNIVFFKYISFFKFFNNYSAYKSVECIEKPRVLLIFLMKNWKKKRKEKFHCPLKRSCKSATCRFIFPSDNQKKKNKKVCEVLPPLSFIIFPGI